MSRSIFDPTGPETEHSGSRNLGPTAQDISHLETDPPGTEPVLDPNTPDTSPVLKQIADDEAIGGDIAKTMPPD